MDSIVLILFLCVIATVTGLNFMELHRIRKRLERGDSPLGKGSGTS